MIGDCKDEKNNGRWHAGLNGPLGSHARGSYVGKRRQSALLQRVRHSERPTCHFRADIVGNSLLPRFIPLHCNEMPLDVGQPWLLRRPATPKGAKSVRAFGGGD